MKNFFVFDEDDKKLWLGIAAAGIFYIVAFSLFWGGFFHQLERVIFTLLVMFLPGYVVLKLYLDNVKISDNRIADKVIVSFGLSVVTMIVPYYLTTYLRPYVFNTDEEGMETINNTGVTVVLLVLVLAIAFGFKYYQNKKKGLV
jgi:uncharacterized membrane protein